MLYFSIKVYLTLVDGSWSNWLSWSTCGSNCKKTRTRSCDSPPPKNGGLDCPGEAEEDTSCTGGDCPVDGNWGSWGSWSSCASDCKKTKTRSCNNPAPVNGGKTCSGSNQSKMTCEGGDCPREGQ